MCNEQTFPEITEQVSIGQLVLFNVESRDGQTRLSLLDEILISISRIINIIATDEKNTVQMGDFVNGFRRAFPDEFLGMVDTYTNVDFVVAYVKRHTAHLSVDLQQLQLAHFKIVPEIVYEKFRDSNKQFLDLYDDFRLSEDEFDDLTIKFDRVQLLDALKPWMEGENNIVDLIMGHKLQDEYIHGTIGGVLVDLLAADNVSLVQDEPFKNIIALWSIAQFTE